MIMLNTTFTFICSNCCLQSSIQNCYLFAADSENVNFFVWLTNLSTISKQVLRALMLDLLLPRNHHNHITLLCSQPFQTCTVYTHKDARLVSLCDDKSFSVDTL